MPAFRIGQFQKAELGSKVLRGKIGRAASKPLLAMRRLE
jgi:hypothetical protein